MTVPLHFFVQLLGTREDWPENMTPEEEKVMDDHFQYLKDLTFKKKVLMAGPCFEPVFGLLVLQAESEKDAMDIVSHDPSISSGVMTFSSGVTSFFTLIANQSPYAALFAWFYF